MAQPSSNNKRILKNTVFLYFRMLITVFIGLYTSRIILKVLGASDYGLYNVVGGIVTMLAFMNGTMANGTQRFLSYEIGEGNFAKLKKVFSNALSLHIIVALAVLLISETLGLWFVYYKLNIPADRHFAALWVYQFSILTFCISIIQVPFMSSLISHEKMGMYAYMSLYDAFAKLLVAIFLPFVTYDKLIIYALLICLAQVSSMSIYILYARRKFEECRSKPTIDKTIIKEITGFSLWTLIGAFGCSANGQGLNILLNLFFGTVINAARGVAFQVNSFVVGFSRNFQVAAAPQIIKYYAEGDVRAMTKLAIRASKLSGYLLLVVMLPIFFNIEYILSLWLGKYPDHTPAFIRIVLVQSLVQSLSGPVVSVTHASGKLKMPNLTGGISIVMSLPVCYVALKLGCNPETVFLLNIIPWLFECFFDCYYAQKYTGFIMRDYYKEVYLRVFSITALCFVIMGLISNIFPISGLLRFLFLSTLCVLFSITLIYKIGLDKEERTKSMELVMNKLKRVKR